MTGWRKESKQQKKRKTLLDSYHPVKLFDEDLGRHDEFLQGNCPYCDTEQTMFVLENEGEFYCLKCKTSKATSEIMQRTIKGFEKEFRSLHDFPDEKYSSLVQALKTKYPVMVEIIRVFADDPEGYKDLNRMRRSKTYKTFPNSLSDEDRLFMTIHSWMIGHKYAKTNIDNLREDEAREEFDRLLKEEGA